MSARAVGGAVGGNPIGIIIPCHRVVGTDGGLTGYSGGLGNKVALLALEGADFFAANSSSPKASRPDVNEKLMELLSWLRRQPSGDARGANILLRQ